MRPTMAAKTELDNAFPTKPKGMHWLTYRRLAKRHEDLTSNFLEQFGAWIDGLTVESERGRRRT